MRKTFVVALVALSFVLAVTSCDIIPTPGAGTDDGLVKVKVLVNEVGSNSRSLTLVNAKKWNYIEVFILDGPSGTSYIHDADTKGELTLSIKTGNYTPDKSLILLGSVSGNDHILLAAGRLKEATNVTIATTSLTFEVTALKANLTSALVIDPNSLTDSSFDTTAGTYNGVPCVQVPHLEADIEATVTIGGFDGTKNSIFITGNPVVSFQKIIGSDGSTAISASTTPVTANSPIGADDLEIGFKFSSNAPAVYRITFEVPVVGMSTDAASELGGVAGAAWKIRGGTTSGTDLTGTDTKNGIALRVVDPDDPDEYAVIGGDGFIIGGEGSNNWDNP